MPRASFFENGVDARGAPTSLAAQAMQRVLLVSIFLLAVLILGLFTFVVRRDAPGDSHVAGAPSGRSAPLDLEPLVAELRSLRELQAETLEALRRLEPRASTRSPAEEEAGMHRALEPSSSRGADLASLEAGLAGLRQAIELQTRETTALLRQVARPTVDASLASQPAIDTFAVDELITHWQTNPDAAKRATLLRTPASLIAAYGPPSEVWRSAKSGLFFAYIRDWGPHAETPVQVGFRICDGYVVDSWTEPYQPGE